MAGNVNPHSKRQKTSEVQNLYLGRKMYLRLKVCSLMSYLLKIVTPTYTHTHTYMCILMFCASVLSRSEKRVDVYCFNLVSKCVFILYTMMSINCSHRQSWLEPTGHSGRQKTKFHRTGFVHRYSSLLRHL